MAIEYSVEVCNSLASQFQQAKLHRPMRPGRYEPGTQLNYEVTGVVPAHKAVVAVEVEKFVGGGFAGQVYRVGVLSVEAAAGAMAGLEVGRTLAMKILIPPSGFSTLFRNVIYGIGFQGPFPLQSNPDAARSGALWQKFIRRAAQLRFGDDHCVNDILATFVDHTLGSCGELSEWVEGRTWRLETDDRVDLLKQWRRGKAVDPDLLGSPEYRAKHRFMHEFVKLLHEMGAPEFARQYEWSTCKSQPNCLKRTETEADPAAGLIAVDFRAGLALLPFLPMSPGDFKLIAQGLGRGSLVQFDRGNLQKLRQFMDAHPAEFADLREAFEQLQQHETIYRNSLPDLTHNHLRLLYSRRLWSTMFDSAVRGWQVRNLTDAGASEKLRRNRLGTLIFFLVGLLPVLGRFFRRLWGRADYRRHYAALLTNAGYFARALRGRMAEKLIVWHRAGRVDPQRALKLPDQPGRFFGHLLLSVLPASLHRLFTDAAFARAKLAYLFLRPVRLYFNAALREQWLRDMVAQGQKNHLVTQEDAHIILGQLQEPFIQKYLKSLAVHVCTLPVTQLVSVTIAIIYYLTHRDEPNAWAIGLGIIGLFQVTPISPGSLCRGLYVLYLVIHERNFKDYNIAVFLGFFKYVGYLAFPIQMAYRYPVLARFMAGHWATGAVHIVPVFGEKGALLEHAVFNLFYNWPLTLRRRMALRARLRESLSPRRWHLVPCTLAGTAAFAACELFTLRTAEIMPTLTGLLRHYWALTLAFPLLTGAAVTLWAGGTGLPRRLIQAAIAGIAVGVLWAIFHALLAAAQTSVPVPSLGFAEQLGQFIWPAFLFSIFSTLGALATEVQLPEPAVAPSN